LHETRDIKIKVTPVKLSNNGDSIRTEQLVSRLLSITQVTKKLPYCRGELAPIANRNAFVSARLFAKRSVNFDEYIPANVKQPVEESIQQ
jgi:hypothetical protein